MYNLVEFMTGKIKLLRIKEAAEMLGINPETLRRWDRSGRLKAVIVSTREIEDIERKM